MASVIPEFDLIVVGAGYAGVHCAVEYERLVPNARVLVLEAADAVGGRARSRPQPHGTAINLGAHYLGIRHRRALTLARRLLGEDQIYSHISNFGPDPAFRMWLDGEWRITTRNTSFLQIQGLSKHRPMHDRLRMFESLLLYFALEQLVDVRRPWDSVFAQYLDSITVEEWVTSQQVPPWIAELWGVACIGLYSTEEHRLSLLYWLWYFASNGGFIEAVNDFKGGPQEFGVRAGLGGLLERHAAELRGQLRTSTAVSRIEHDRAGACVTTADGERLRTARVVIALSPATAGRIAFDPLPSEPRRLLQSQPMGHACKVIAHYREPWWHDSLEGQHFIGYQGGSIGGLEWILDTSVPGTSEHRLMCFVHPRMWTEHPDPTALDAALREELARVTGDERARAVERFDLHNWVSEGHVGGGPNTIMGPRVLSRLEPILQRPEGRLWFCSSEYSTEFSGYVEGALAAGEVTAMQLAGQLDTRTGGRGARPLLAAGIYLGHLAAKLGARMVAPTAATPASAA
jgi:monoamine oxidase